MAPGYTVEPIQIAASNLDFDGLKLLLKSGADPKGTGDVDGTIGTQIGDLFWRGMPGFGGKARFTL